MKQNSHQKIKTTKNRYQRYVDQILEKKVIAISGLAVVAVTMLLGATEGIQKVFTTVSGRYLRLDSVRIQQEASGATAILLTITNSGESTKLIKSGGVTISSVLRLNPCGMVPTSSAPTPLMKEHVLIQSDLSHKRELAIDEVIQAKSTQQVKVVLLAAELDTLYKFRLEIDAIGVVGEYSFFFPDLFVSSLSPLSGGSTQVADYNACQRKNAKNLLVEAESPNENFHLVEARNKAKIIPDDPIENASGSGVSSSTIRRISDAEAERNGVVLVYLRNGNTIATTFHCNGGLMSTPEKVTVVATAAHCLVNRITGQKYDITQIAIKTPTGKLIPIRSVLPFEYKPNAVNHDVAYIEVTAR